MFHRDLNALLAARKDEIVTSLVDHLQRPQASRYRELGPVALEQRARKLVQSLLASGEANHSAWAAGIPLVQHVTQIAEKRISEGFGLQELQLALSKLEEKVWQLVAAHRDPAAQVRDLSRVTYVIGSAKDRLALVYLAQRDHAESEMARLRARLRLLSRGTASAPMTRGGSPIKPSPTADY